jgi:hypothetical protein
VLLDFSPHGDDSPLKFFVLFGKAFAMFRCSFALVSFTAVSVIAFSFIVFPFPIGAIAIVPFTTLVTSTFFVTIAIAPSFFVTLPVAVSPFFSTAFFIPILVTRLLSIGFFLGNLREACRGFGLSLRFLCCSPGGFCVRCFLSNRGQ